MSTISLSLHTESEEEIIGWHLFARELFLGLVSEIMEEVHFVEQFFIKMKTFYAFISQVCFFILVDSILEKNGDFRDLKSDKSVIMALTSILFYSVFGYFVTRVKDIFQTHRLTIFTSLRSGDQLLHWVIKLILEWAKAVVLVVCLREQGINYSPSISYSIVTFIYYLCTEKIFTETLPEIVEIFNIDLLDNLEYLYVPMILNFIAITAAFVASMYIYFIQCSSFLLLSMYFLLYIRLKDIYHNQWKLLQIEKAMFRSFKIATREEIIAWSDICAICLNTMSKARMTPCKHLFHPLCLKQCLKSSFLCPLCKSNFLDHIEYK
ncbi:uncharacterized protein [Diabrotica undecimpunctata]|uniref:uncharacterized protein isoform X1 n=2 Tax=Diabrotica undecimpunctata TaxID=50387 RepID=UPI003B63ACCD